MEKMKQYRVVAMHTLAKHTGSDFEKFADIEDARKWAIAFGKKKGSDSVWLGVKSESRYNHYDDIENIVLN